MKKLFIILSAFFLVACSKEPVNETDVITYQIFQTLDDNSGLAIEPNNEDTDVVKIVSFNTEFYDGLKMTSKWVMFDTYTYMTVSGVRKTVPVYMKSSEYRKTHK